MRTALITGSRGFLGRHLATAASAAGEGVVGLDRHDPEHPIDLADAEGLLRALSQMNPDVIYHLAGVTKSSSVRDFYDANVVGTANLFEALHTLRSAARVVVVSSSAVYGSPETDAPLDEDTPLRPITHYGASKVGQEAVSLRAHRALQIPVVVVRPFNLVGPGQPATFASGAFAAQVARAERSGERSVRVGNLSGSRDFVDVRDVARACVLLGTKGAPGTAYNVASGSATPLLQCLELLVSRAKVQLDIELDPSRLQASDARAQVGDHGRITRDTGWRPEVAFADSMGDLLETCRAELVGKGGRE